jgi:glycine dehydrogenase
MAMQAREQHIKRAKATSNICTAQALLANMASAYGTYHGPEGLTNIAKRIHSLTHLAAEGLSQKYSLETENYFDTLTFEVGSDRDSIVRACEEEGLNVRVFSETKIGLNFGENFTKKDMVGLFKGFGIENAEETVNSLAASINSDELHFASTLKRQSHFMTHPVFNSHHSETRMLRYLKYLENRDLALNTSMISLGSCTMKLNAVSEMIPVTWPEVTNIHPFAPSHQVQGYHEMMRSLADDLAKITGFDAISLAPNSGANGEYAGLLAIKKFHESNGDMQRDVCFVPMSAHGTNPASAVMAGMRVVIINNKENGDIDMDDLRAKVDKHGDKLAAVMITYPSTYGKFEEGILDINELVHNAGGQVYMDGANMNAQVALTSPGFMNADVCHLNLHKTFCIPHGGGGPGVGAIGVKSHLAPFLPGHAVVPTGGEGANVTEKADGAVTAAPYGSAAILPISWMYIKMLGEAGLKTSTTTAILNANYMAKRLEQSFKILYRGSNGQCAHEFIIDLNPFKTCGVSAEDVAKRLQDYGFHSPTMSWPLPGSLMVEPTESEDRAELDRFCDAMVSIRQEIRDIEEERILYEESPLFHAPHTQQVALSDEWDRNYSREQAAFPLPWVRHNKFWPSVGRIDNVYGDRNLICSCPPVEDYMEEEKAAGSG